MAALTPDQRGLLLGSYGKDPAQRTLLAQRTLGGERMGAAQPGLSNAQSQGPSNPLDPTYANFGAADERYAKALRQQAAIRKSIFQPQYEKAMNFALDESAPNRAGFAASDQANKYNALSREQFMRMNERSQTAIDPSVARETSRLTAFDEAKNVANSFTNAREATRETQADQLGEVTGLGISSARQALGLSAGAASAYTDRQNRNAQAEMAQQQANAAAQSANMQMMGAVMTSIATVVGAAIA